MVIMVNIVVCPLIILSMAETRASNPDTLLFSFMLLTESQSMSSKLYPVS